MEQKTKMYLVRGAVVAVVFGSGYFCGTVTQRNADAQMSEMGSELMKKAGGSGGTVGSVAQMGTAIMDMQKQVDGLQKNLNILRNVKSVLGGGK